MAEQPYPVTVDELEAELERVENELDKPVEFDSDNARDRRVILRQQRWSLIDLIALRQEKDTADTVTSVFEPPGDSAMHPSQRP